MIRHTPDMNQIWGADSILVIKCVTNALSFACQPPGVVVTESQTFKKRSDFQSNDDYAVYVRENIQVRSYACLFIYLGVVMDEMSWSEACVCKGGHDGTVLQNVWGSIWGRCGESDQAGQRRPAWSECAVWLAAERRNLLGPLHPHWAAG